MAIPIAAPSSQSRVIRIDGHFAKYLLASFIGTLIVLLVLVGVIVTRQWPALYVALAFAAAVFFSIGALLLRAVRD